MNTETTHIPHKVTGTIPKNPNKIEIKTVLFHKTEIARFKTLFNHSSIQLDKDSVASMSLVMRRALVLLADYQRKTLDNEESIEKERLAYFRLAKTGNTVRGS